MQNRGVARFALFLGGMAAVVSWWAFAARQTILDPTATCEAALGLLQAAPIQSKAIDSVTSQLDSMLPPNLLGAHPGATKIAATKALTDPQVAEAFAAEVGSVHEQLLTKGGTHKELVVDTATVTAAVRAALEPIDPRLARSMDDKTVTFKFDTSKLPDLSGTRSTAPLVALMGALTALAMWALAILMHPEHFVAIRRIGRRLIGVGTAPIIMWVIIPALFEQLNADVAQTLSPLSRSYGRRLAPAAMVIVSIGFAVWLGGRVGARALARRQRESPNSHDPAHASRRSETHALGRSRANARHRRTSTPQRVDVKL